MEPLFLRFGFVALYCSLTGEPESGKVILDDCPDAMRPDFIVVVPESVSQSADFRPRLVGDKGGSDVSELGCSFADSFQAAFDRIADHAAFLKRFFVETSGVFENRPGVLDDIVEP
jgi:hypothetical protein